MSNPLGSGVRVLRRPDFPTRGTMPFIPLHRVGPEANPRPLVILSSEVDQRWVHWLGANTLACTGDETACRFDHQHYRPQWLGSLFVWEPEARELRWAVIRQGAAEEEPRLLVRGYDLRGRLLVLRRDADSERGAQHARVEGLFPHVAALPSCPSMDRHLARVWRGHARKADFWFELEELPPVPPAKEGAPLGTAEGNARWRQLRGLDAPPAAGGAAPKTNP